MATKAYTGIMLSYNKSTKLGSILVDSSSDSLQPNIFFQGSDLPNGFVFTDTKYKSTITQKTIQDKVNSKSITVNEEVLTKDSNGNLILQQVKVSFNYDTVTKKISNLITT